MQVGIAHEPPPPVTDFDKRGTFDRESQAILGSTRGSSLDHNKVIHRRRSGTFHCGHHILDQFHRRLVAPHSGGCCWCGLVAFHQNRDGILGIIFVEWAVMVMVSAAAYWIALCCIIYPMAKNRNTTWSQFWYGPPSLWQCRPQLTRKLLCRFICRQHISQMLVQVFPYHRPCTSLHDRCSFRSLSCATLLHCSLTG